MFFIQENVAFNQVPIISHTTYKQWKKRTFDQEQILCKPPKKREELTAQNTVFA